MKKLKYLLFILLMVPCFVKADMAGPLMKPYKMVVINPAGIDYYKQEYDYTKDSYTYTVAGHLNKDQIFKVEIEYDNYYQIIINDERYALKNLNGTKLVTDEVDPTKESDEFIKKTNNRALVYAENGVDIRKGPSNAYDKIGHIKKGEKIEYTYFVGDDEASIACIYVDYNGKKGWVDILEGKVLIEQKRDFITMEDYKLSDTIIPKNTIVRSYYSTDIWSHKSLVEYNNYKELVHRNEKSKLLEMGPSTVIAKKEFKVYTEANNKGTEVTTIPNNAQFTSLAEYMQRGVKEEQRYVEYQNKKGWIKISDWEERELIFDDSDTDVNENGEETIGDIAPSPNKKDEKKTKKQTPEDYTLTYVIIGSSVALAALMVIILVNKKKKLKTVQSQGEVIQEENKELK